MNIFNAMIHHNVNFGAKHDFTIWLNDSYQNSDADYLKTSNPRQWLVDNNLLLCPVYMYKPIDRLAITMRTGLCWQKKKVNESRTRNNMYPNMWGCVSIKLNKNSALSLDAGIASSLANTTVENSAEQQINQYEVMRGNPEIKNVKFISSDLRHDFTYKGFNFSANVSYEGSSDVTKNIYLAESGEAMVHSFVSEGKYHTLSYGINTVVCLFNKSLQWNAMCHTIGKKLLV